ncbi:hypothetical protein FQN55_001813 [Onygenales sp. PD_40]|nr:hypothetical protein FQN55_001813 [Onygenales sp. PD_40]
MDQALGLTHLPQSQLQQDSAGDIEDTLDPRACPQSPVSPSRTPDTRLRQQSPDSLFSDGETLMPWETQELDNPCLENDAEGTAENGNVLAHEYAGHLPNQSPTPPATGAQSQRKTTPYKRPKDDFSPAETQQHPAKKRCLDSIAYPSYDIGDSSDLPPYSDELFNDQFIDIPCFPPDAELPELLDIPEFLSSFQLPDGFDFNALDPTWDVDGGANRHPSELAPGLISANKSHSNRRASIEGVPNASESNPSSEKLQHPSTVSESTGRTSISSYTSSLSSLPAASDHICNPDNPKVGYNDQNRTPSEVGHHYDSIFGDEPSPTSLASAKDISEGINVAQFRLMKDIALDKPSSAQFTENEIRKTFNIEEEDLLATQYREVFRHIPKPPQYVSPYPQRCGPLGYFPSAPTTHVRFMEVAPDDMAERLEQCREKIRIVSVERTKYRNACADWMTPDPRTGKTKEQMLKEEPWRLKRALNAQEKKTKLAEQEAGEWRDRYRHLAVAYNGLVSHLHMIQSSQIPPHQGPRAQFPHPHPTPATSPQPESVSYASATEMGTSPPGPARPVSQPLPITIDLTDDSPAKETSKTQAPTPSTVEPSQRQYTGNLRAAMRRKEYQWLGNKNHMQKRLQPIQGPAIQFVRDDLRPEPANLSRRHSAEPSHSGGVRNLNNPTPPDGDANRVPAAERLTQHTHGDNDGLAQMLAAELEGCG